LKPVFFRIGNFPIAFYGLLIALGVLAGVFVAVRRARKVGVAPEFILDMAFFGVLIGFIGSRVLYILTDLPEFFRDPLPLILTRSGYVFFGGLIAAIFFSIWFIRRRRVDPWQIGDVFAPSVALGHAFGRVGCFFSGCCYGAICPAGWTRLGVRFPKVVDPHTGDLMFSFAYQDHLRNNLIPESATHSLPVFPVQLYEAGANLLIFAGLMLLWRRRRFRGQVFAAYLAAYGATRFLTEFLRGDYYDLALRDYLYRGQMSQIVSLIAVAAGITIWLLRRHTPLESPDRYGSGAPKTEPAETAPDDARSRSRHRKPGPRKPPANIASNG
jgi:phosphatidylglycerol:prolipoprotein diacylglycerol transferase